MDKLKNKDVLLIIILLILIMLVFFLTKKDNENKYNNKTNVNYIILTDANDFFTLEGCVNRYISLLSNKESKDLLKLLDSTYITNNKITEDNAFNKISSLDGFYNFNAKKIYFEKISANVYKYYIYGKLKKDTINGNDLGSDYYLIITMDKEKLLFNVTPYDGKIFKEDI